MQIFILNQVSDRWPTNPNVAFAMIVIAETEEEARNLAQQNENKERDDGLLWDANHATCKPLEATGKARVVLVA